ncbi:MAG: hypothetical protein JXA21_01960, partial [Anaerolineae bacterium]|nr:hypothetical protein [Anaerolineae bacterium]
SIRKLWVSRWHGFAAKAVFNRDFSLAGVAANEKSPINLCHQRQFRSRNEFSDRHLPFTSWPARLRFLSEATS